MGVKVGGKVDVGEYQLKLVPVPMAKISLVNSKQDKHVQVFNSK